MDFLLIAVVFIISMIVKAANTNKKKEAAKKAAGQAGKKAVPGAAAPDGGGVADAAPFPGEFFPAVEGECAPDHVHTAGTQERHILKPSYETGHAHTEASMSGFDDACPNGEGTGAILQGEDSMSRNVAEGAEACASAASGAKATVPGPTVRGANAVPAPESAFEPGSPVTGMDADKLREAMVFSEILAKPKALRPRVRI